MFTSLFVRLVRVSRLADRAYLSFNRLRSRVVLSLAGNRFFDAYNAVAYMEEPAHREGPDARDLRPWEQDLVANLPAPPARVLLGGAGAGREAYALEALGYTVVAFDPAKRLVEAMQTTSASRTRRRTARGRLPGSPGPPRARRFARRPPSPSPFRRRVCRLGELLPPSLRRRVRHGSSTSGIAHRWADSPFLPAWTGLGCGPGRLLGGNRVLQATFEGARPYARRAGRPRGRQDDCG